MQTVFFQNYIRTKGRRNSFFFVILTNVILLNKRYISDENFQYYQAFYEDEISLYNDSERKKYSYRENVLKKLYI